MNPISLTFESKSLENKFQEEVRIVYNKIFISMIAAYGTFIGFPGIIISCVWYNISDIMVYSTATIASLIYYLVATYKSQYYNIWICSINIFSAFIMGGQLFFFGPTIGINDEYVLFFFGAVGFQLHVTVAFLSTSFLLSFAQLAIAVTTYYTVCRTNKLFAYKWGYGVFVFFIVYFLYIIQKNRREIFLMRENEKEWAQIVKKGLSQSIITVKYDQKNNCIMLDMINDQARKLLKLHGKEEFKVFSRKTFVFDNLKDYSEEPESSQCDFKSQFNQMVSTKQGDKSKNTLENRIISILRQHIWSKLKPKESNNIPLPKESHSKKTKKRNNIIAIKLTKLKQTTSDYNQVKQVEDLFFGVFKKDDDSDEQKISIKASTYQNQTDCFCCLVIEEETNKQKVKILEGINKNFENNFLQFCLKVGEKLQCIVVNIHDQQNIKAIISQCYNMIYNLKDHVSILKNNFKMRTNNLAATQASLGEIQNTLISRFQNRIGEINLKINSINCSSDLIISSYIDKLLQIITNQVDNSIKSSLKNPQKQQTTTHQTHQYQQLSDIQQSEVVIDFQNTHSEKQQRSNENIKENHDQDIINGNKIERINYIRSPNPYDLGIENNQGEQCQSCETDHLHKLNILTQSEFPKTNPQDITINFELLKGDSNISNVIKVSISDSGPGMKAQQMASILETISTKNPAFDSEYQNYSNLGWKVNYHMIGNLGPFFNFFVKNNESHHNLDILSIRNGKQSNLFSNGSFQQQLITSNNECFHVNKIPNFKEKPKNETTTVHNYSPQQSLLKLSSPHHCISTNNILRATPSYFKKESSTKDQSFEYSLSMSEDMNFPSQNLRYKLPTKFMAEMLSISQHNVILNPIQDQ